MVAAHRTLHPQTKSSREKPRPLPSQPCNTLSPALCHVAPGGRWWAPGKRCGCSDPSQERPPALPLRCLSLWHGWPCESHVQGPREVARVPAGSWRWSPRPSHHALRQSLSSPRLLAQLNETEAAFDEFWAKHQQKLQQCLQLRHFEQDFREVSNYRGGAWWWAPGAVATGGR